MLHQRSSLIALMFVVLLIGSVLFSFPTTKRTDLQPIQPSSLLSSIPVIALESIGNNSILFSGTPIELNITGVDLDTVWHSWDNGANVTITTPYVVRQPGSDGIHTLRVYANDTLGAGSYVTFQFTTKDNTFFKSLRFGGGANDECRDVAIDSDGNVIFAGMVKSADLPVHMAYQANLNGPSDAFICKLTPDLETVLYCTYYGGSSDDEAEEVIVDDGGNCYIVGTTQSSNFPTVAPFQATLGGGYDAFVIKLSSSGQPVYSTYLGGSSTDRGYGIALDSNGCIIVAGETWSGDFPVENAYQPVKNVSSDCFITKFNSTGTGLNFSTFYGGSAYQWIYDVDAIDDNAIVITGVSEPDPWFPIINPLPTSGSGADGFVAALNGSGIPQMSSFIGGSSLDVGYNIMIDDQRRIYVMGTTESTNFPMKNPIQSNLWGWGDLFLMKINSTWNGIEFSTYLGGYARDYAGGLDLDTEYNIYVAGYGGSVNYPVYNSVQHQFLGQEDYYITVLDTTGQSLLFSTYLGSSVGEKLYGIASESVGSCIVTGIAPTGFPFNYTIRGGIMIGPQMSRIVRVGIDQINPTISLVSPANNSAVMVGENIQFEINDAETGVCKALYVWDTDSSNTTLGDDPYIAVVPDISLGVHELAITAIDKAGNYLVERYVFDIHEAITPTTTTSTTGTPSTTTSSHDTTTSSSTAGGAFDLATPGIIIGAVGAILVIVLVVKRKS
jgi:hypothetical protein